MLIENLPADIIGKCLKNDTDAWTTLFKATFPLAKWIALSSPFNLDHSTSEDIAQEVVIALCEKIGEVKNIKAFISTVTHNKCVDYLRKKNPAQPNTSMINLEYISISYDSNIETDIFEIIKKHVESMNKSCHDLLRCRFFNEMSYKEISENLDLSVSKVGVYLARCLVKLKNTLKNDNPKFFEELERILKC